MCVCNIIYDNKIIKREGGGESAKSHNLNVLIIRDASGKCGDRESIRGCKFSAQGLPGQFRQLYLESGGSQEPGRTLWEP